MLLITAALYAQAPPRVVILAGPPANVRNIWVLQADNMLAMYDATQFHKWQTMKLPNDARKNPESISIGRSRVVLFVYPPDGRTALRRLWSSNVYAPELVGGAWDQHPASGGGFSILEASPAVYFSDDGQRLYWFEHRQQRVNRGPDVSRDARFMAWSTDLKGDDPKPITQFSFAPCKCETGACSESCPEAQVWAPDEGVGDFFFVTRWVPGQIGSDFQDTTVYQRNGETWTSRKLGGPVERFLDAADHGNLYIEATPDGGCCGWANESNDTTSVVRGETATVIFDERRRFHNNNYDVSFFTDKAAFSPDAQQVAYTVVASSLPEGEIRVSSDGKANPEELKSIKQAMSELPRVEVIALSAPEKVAATLANAELVGWIDAQRLLVVTKGELQVVDAGSGKPTPTGIKADAAKYVFLR